MPSSPPRSCRCGAVVPAGTRCPRCTKASDRQRGSAASRGYDATWQRFRTDLLKRPEFQRCGRCGAPATDLDHIQSVREAPHRRLDPTNLRPLCHRCHSARTIEEQGVNRGRER